MSYPSDTPLSENYDQLIENLESRMHTGAEKRIGGVPMSALEIARDIMRDEKSSEADKRSVQDFIKGISPRGASALFEIKLSAFFHFFSDSGNSDLSDVRAFMKDWMTGHQEEAWRSWCMAFTRPHARMAVRPGLRT